MSWGKYAAGASGAVIGGILGNIPGAIAGGKLAYEAAKGQENFTKKKSMVSYGITPPRTPAPRKRKRGVSKKKKSIKKKAKVVYSMKAAKKTISKRIRRNTRKRYSGISTGGNAGGFQAPTSAGLKMFKNLTTFLKNGYHITKEDHGVVSDSDCVYIYHSNYRRYEISKVLTGALLRKLFRKGGMEIDNLQTELPLYDIANSDGFRITFTLKNPIDQTYASNDYITVNNESFDRIVTEMCVAGGGRIGDYMQNFMANSTFAELYKFCLYISDRNGLDTNWRLISELNLENEKVELVLSSKLVVQNRTKGSGAPAEDANIERVDNQPVKGMIYEFGNADPRLKSSAIIGGGVDNNEDFLINTGSLVGIRTFGGTQMVGPGGGQYMREPPAPKLWKNIAKVSKVKLEPGEMKSTTVYNNYSNNLQVILRKLRAQLFGTGPGNMGIGYRGITSCSSQIIAMEEVLRTPGDNLILSQWENEFKCGAYCITKKKFGVLTTDMIVPSAPIAQFTA